MSYRLENAEARSRKRPQFFIPEREERDSVQPGDIVKLIFLVEDRDDPISSELMWVEVEGRTDDGCYVGRLDNDPSHIDASAGDAVRFGPEHIIEIWDSTD